MIVDAVDPMDTYAVRGATGNSEERSRFIMPSATGRVLQSGEQSCELIRDDILGQYSDDSE